MTYKLALLKTYGYSIVRRIATLIKRAFSNRYIMIHSNIDLRQYDRMEEES